MRAGARVLTAALVVALGTTRVAMAQSSVEPTRDLAAGGLVYGTDSGIVTDQQELVIGNTVKSIYALRNTGNGPRTILIAFPLPDLDQGSAGENGTALPAPNVPNFLDATITVDNAPVSLNLEQRAIVLGLDVTRYLEQAGVPLQPMARAASDLLSRLPAQVRAELQQRGIIRTEERRPTPAWVLKTTAYWFQAFAPRQTVRVALAYKPVVATARYSPAVLDQLRTSACIDSVVEADLTRRVAATAGNVGFRWMSLSLSSTAHLAAASPVSEFRLLIEKPAIDTILATCRKGLRRLGPTALEWRAKAYVPDEDLSVLFID